MPRIKRRITKKRDNMDAEYERLAEIKSINKTLGAEASLIQEKILDSPHKMDKVDTSYGELSLRSRERWKVNDKDDLIIEMGQEEYNEYSTISKTGIVKAVGKKGLKQYEEYGIMELGSVTEYYQLKDKK